MLTSTAFFPESTTTIQLFFFTSCYLIQPKSLHNFFRSIMQWSSFGVLVKSVWVFKLKSLFNDHSLENIYLTRLFFSHFLLFLPITTASVYIGQMPFWFSVLWGNLKLKQKEGLYKPAWSVLSHQLKQILKHLWSL